MAQQLDPNDILTAEFHYIAQAAAQNNEDRARVATNYLVTFGSFIAAALSAQSDGLSEAARRDLNLSFTIIFSLLSLYSILTIVQLARLRLSWLDCVRAMNQIKDVYIKQSGEPALAAAFRWTTLPASFNLKSVSFILAFQVAILGGLTAGAAAQFLQFYLGAPDLTLSIAKGIGVFAAQLILYGWMLRK